MKKPFFLLFIFAFFVTCTNKSTKTNDRQQKPNIIFIMADDHAYQAISAYDSTLIKTPNIDRLASRGMRFDQAFVSNSICSPSRAVLLTGKFSHLNGLKDNIDVFDSSQVTFPKILQQHGYSTAVVGKWHLKSPPSGFNFWKVVPDQGHYYQPEFRTPNGLIKEQGYVTDVITDIAIQYLDSIRDKSKPFMLMYHHKAPHREWLPSQKHIELYKDKLFPEPSSLFDDYNRRGKAAKEAEMRIADHMGLSNDNKIHPDTLAKLGKKEFLNWYVGNYLANYNRMTDEEKEKWNSVYGLKLRNLLLVNPKTGS